MKFTVHGSGRAKLKPDHSFRDRLAYLFAGMGFGIIVVGLTILGLMSQFLPLPFPPTVQLTSVIVISVLGIIVLILAITAAFLLGERFELILYPFEKSIQLYSRPWSIPKDPRTWDSSYVASLEARIVKKQNGAEEIGIYMKLKNGTEEKILRERGTKIPKNSIEQFNIYLNDLEKFRSNSGKSTTYED